MFSSFLNFLSMISDWPCVKMTNQILSFFQRFHALGHQSLWMLVWVFPRPMGESDISTNFIHPFAINSQKVFVLFSHNFYFTNAQKQHNQAKLNFILWEFIRTFNFWWLSLGNYIGDISWLFFFMQICYLFNALCGDA